MRDLRGLIDRKLAKIKQLQGEIDILNAAANLLHDEGDNNQNYGNTERRPEVVAKPNGRAEGEAVATRFP